MTLNVFKMILYKLKMGLMSLRSHIHIQIATQNVNLTLWVGGWIFKVPWWRYTVAIWRKPWTNTKRRLHNISLLLLSAFFIDWLIIFEFGFTEFIHCWLINTENYDNGLPLKLSIISTTRYFVVPRRFRLFKVFTSLTIATLHATKGSCQAK